MRTDKVTSFDYLNRMGGGLQKSKLRKSEPFREQYKRYVWTSPPSLQSLINYIIIMYKN